ncbi:MAG TPA: YdeI/OmpD-associated family protein [Gemmatimonadaceae bacterium]
MKTFRTAGDFSAWLEKNHARSTGVWARIAKKGSKTKSMSYAEGLDVALCYGWIDALKKPESEAAWLQRFVPRRKASLWSKINREKALALIERGEMRAPGHAEIARARGDGRWDAAYDSPATATVPAELDDELARRPKAREFFDTLDRVNRYAIIWRVQTAKKPETRMRRIALLVDMLEKGEKLH